MKKVYIILFLMVIALPGVFGQLQFGVKGGIVSSSTSLDTRITNLPQNQDINYDALEMEAMESKVGFQAGFFGRISLASLYVQPELLFTSTGSKVKVTEVYESSTQENVETVKNQEFKKIDIPLMAGFKFGPARIQAGPVGSIMLDHQSAIEAATNYKEEFNGATWGYQVGVGLDLFNALTLDAKYEGSLSKLGERVKIGDKAYSIDNRPNQYVVTLGIFF
ncbi:MAG: PorT family protein [Bacteroidales bacterium]|nr:PorT family protein [Bacteroidales bacterium]